MLPLQNLTLFRIFFIIALEIYHVIHTHSLLDIMVWFTFTELNLDRGH